MSARSVRMRLVTAAALLVALMAVTAGCGSSEGTDVGGKDGTSAKSDESVIMIMGPLTDPLFGAMRAGAEQASKDLGVSFKYVSLDIANLQTSTVRTLQAAIAQHPTAIVVGNFIPASANPQIKRAVAAGIPVVIDQSGQDEWEQVGAVGFVGYQPEDVGVRAARLMLDADANDVLCVDHVPGNPLLERLCKSFSRAIAAGGGKARVLTIPAASSTNAGAVSRNIGAALTADKEIDGVFTLGSGIATNALTAIDSAQLKGKVKVGTLNLSKAVLAKIQSGELLFSLDEQPFLEGYYGVLMGVHYARYGLRPSTPISTGPDAVTRANVQQVIRANERYAGIRGAS